MLCVLRQKHILKIVICLLLWLKIFIYSGVVYKAVSYTHLEPHVPDYHNVISDIQKLSSQLGKQAIGIRYDPIFINQEYTIEKHLYYFEDILSQLQGYVHHLSLIHI